MSRIRKHFVLVLLLTVLITVYCIPSSYAETPLNEEIKPTTATNLDQADELVDYTVDLHKTVDLPAYLDSGLVINSKMKSIAAGTSVESYDPDKFIKAIHRAHFLPDYFIPSESNTISSPSSPVPIYIFFDNTDDSGLMYVYTESNRIIADPSLISTFCFMQSLSDISELADWDTANVTDMGGTFVGTYSLLDITPLSNWNTANVVSFQATFYQSGIVDASPLSNWDTSSATTMMFMFAKDSALQKIDVSNWNTRKVTNMNSMFSVGDSYMGNGQLQEIIGLGNLDVSSVTDMTCMFYGAGSMTHYDIARWDVSNVESFNHMFCDNFKLESLDLSAWNVSKVKTIFCMFDDNHALTTIGDVSHWDTSSLIDAGGWLNFAGSFVGENGVLDLSGWNTENLKSAGEMFRRIKCNTIDLSGWTFDSITNDPWPEAGKGIYYESGNKSAFKGMAGMFLEAIKLNTVRISMPGYISYQNAVSRGLAINDMWKGVPEGYFTLPYIPQYCQKVLHHLHSFVQNSLNLVLVFLKNPS